MCLEKTLGDVRRIGMYALLFVIIIYHSFTITIVIIIIIIIIYIINLVLV